MMVVSDLSERQKRGGKQKEGQEEVKFTRSSGSPQSNVFFPQRSPSSPRKGPEYADHTQSLNGSSCVK